MKLRSVLDAQIIPGTRVLLRIDADVVFVGKKIAPESAYRLDCALATIKFLLKQKAEVTVMAHRGRPAGRKVTALSLVPVQKYIETKIGRKIKFLPNTRFDIREEKNDANFARELAKEQDIFVNDAFATAHRKHASTYAIATILPSYAGLQFLKEVHELTEIRDHAPQPFALIIGGSKIESKVPVIESFFKIAQHIFVVGAAANAFFVAQGMKVGDSLVTPASVRAAKKLLLHKNVILPSDVVVKSGKKSRVVVLPEQNQAKKFIVCENREMILDIGPASVVLMSEMLASARGIVWNGPAGKFEERPYHLGSIRLARMLSYEGRAGAHVVIGGGETVSVVLQSKMSQGLGHISTGGGAMLDFLSGKQLPAIDVLLIK